MDADKLNEAAEKYFKEESAFRPPCLCKGFVFDAFLAGAQWLMTHPLADRMTEEEKERIKKLYLTDEEIDGVKSAFGAYPVAAATITKNILEQIFSKEQFNQPTEV